MLSAQVAEALKKAEVAAPVDVASARNAAENFGGSLVRALLTLTTVSEKRVAEVLAESFGLELVSLAGFSPPPEATSVVPAELAGSHHILPYRLTHTSLVIAASQPPEYDLIRKLQFQSGRLVTAVLTLESELSAQIEEYTRSRNLPDTVYEIVKDLDPHMEVELLNAAQELELEDDADTREIEAPVIRLVNNLIAEGVRRGASDLHIEPQEQKIEIRFRIDGLLHTIIDLPKRLLPAVVNRVKIMCEMDIAERRRPQDGRTNVRAGGRVFELRVSTLPTNQGEKTVIRLLDQSSLNVTLAELGLSSKNLQRFEPLLDHPQGLILLTGPTGSGKTTTLYAVLNRLSVRSRNIVTVEDPVEYRLSGISQVQVNERAGMTFASSLRSILRQDPDIVMVGEIRDAETARIAFQAGQTGHLVLSTLHTNDAVAAITRLVDMGIEPFIISSSLIAIATQRLVRIICKDCREEVEPEPAVITRLGAHANELPCACMGRGCLNCGETGYRGRAAIFELIVNTPEIRHLINIRAEESDLLAQARAQGTLTLFEDGLEKVKAGVTSLSELLRVAPPLSQRSAAQATAAEAPGSQPCSPPAPAPPAAPRQRSRPSTGMEGRILVAEDDNWTRSMLARLLKDNDYEVIEVENGSKAVEKVFSEAPDLVLSDINMPGVDGFSLLKTVKTHADTRHIPVIMLTALSQGADQIRGLDLGADDYVTKPFDADVLLARIRRTLTRSEQ